MAKLIGGAKPAYLSNQIISKIGFLVPLNNKLNWNGWPNGQKLISQKLLSIFRIYSKEL